VEGSDRPEPVFFITLGLDKPLAYNVVWKTVIYVLAALVIHYLERLVDFWKEAGGQRTANRPRGITRI
jgi:hypothetical protein